MKRLLLLCGFFAPLVAAVPAHAAGGGIHTWSLIPYLNHVLQKALGTNTDMNHAIMYTIVCIFLALAGAFVGGNYSRQLKTGDIKPAATFSFTNLIETIIGAVLSLGEEIIGPKCKKFLPLLGTLALVILFNNLAGLIPGSGLATSNLNTTLALALVVFILYHYYGIREHGVLKYLEHFMGPLEGGLKYAMAPIMVPIELISHFARPMSLSLRLFGNMTGDHTILGVFMVGLGISLPLFFPMPFLALGMLVSIIQALVFVLLTMVYISLATQSEH